MLFIYLISGTSRTSTDLLMTSWRAFEIGIGKHLKYSSLKSVVNCIESLETILEHSNSDWKLEKEITGQLLKIGKYSSLDINYTIDTGLVFRSLDLSRLQEMITS